MWLEWWVYGVWGSWLVVILSEKSKESSLWMSVVMWWSVIWMVLQYDWGMSGYQGVCEWYGVSLGVDGMSLGFLLLMGFLMPICVLSSYGSVNSMESEYYILMYFMEVCLVMLFLGMDGLWFYIWFEVLLLPVFLMIGIWGGEGSLNACYYMLVMGVGGSVLMLIVLCYMSQVLGGWDIMVWFDMLGEVEGEKKLWMWWGIFLCMGVKLPVFPFHVWLPLAHVEAPIGGSMVLAGILLKVGGYGMLSYLVWLFPKECEYYYVVICWLGCFSMIWGALSVMSQVDLKSCVAYSSVSHMGLVCISLFSGEEGEKGSFLFMVAHGLTSCGLFLSLGCVYESYSSSLVGYFSGLGNIVPFFSWFSKFFWLSNMGIPCTLNFVSELNCILSIFGECILVGFLALLGMVGSAGYSLSLNGSVWEGYVGEGLLGFSDLSSSELILMLTLSVGVVMMGFFPGVICGVIEH